MGENDDRIIRLECPCCGAMSWSINKEFSIQSMRYCPRCGAKIADAYMNQRQATRRMRQLKSEIFRVASKYDYSCAELFQVCKEIVRDYEELKSWLDD